MRDPATFARSVFGLVELRSESSDYFKQPFT